MLTSDQSCDSGDSPDTHSSTVPLRYQYGKGDRSPLAGAERLVHLGEEAVDCRDSECKTLRDEVM